MTHSHTPVPDHILHAFINPEALVDCVMHEAKVSLVDLGETLATPRGRRILAALRDLSTTRNTLSTQFWVMAALQHLCDITRSLEPGETSRRAAQGILNFITTQAREIGRAHV